MQSLDDFVSMKRSIERLIVDSNTCNDKDCGVLDLSSFSNLKVFEVGEYSFTYVKEVKLIGLNQLERVEIGRKCFAETSDCHDYSSNHHFYLKNCERVKELKIGCHSFSDYSVCVIENVPSLEVIEMGELNESSWIFHDASLGLKSDYDEVE